LLEGLFQPMHLLVCGFVVGMPLLVIVVVVLLVRRQTQAAGRAPVSATPEQSLKNLVRLKEQGLITDAEYQQKRQQLLDDI
jgi:hypothetical protein